MTQEADVIVVGLGTSGEELSGRLAMAGLDVVGVEPALVGGQCAFWACLPTKTMIRAAQLLEEARRADDFAGHVDVTPDWPLVAERIREEVTGNWDDSPAVQRFEERGGRLVRGHAKLTSSDSVVVDGQEFTARRGIVISAGSKPVVPPVEGLDEVSYWTNNEAVSAEELPGSLLVLGGGVVGCELGQVFSRFGVDVTIVEEAERLLSSEEPEAGDLLRSAFEAEGITVRTDTRVDRIAHMTGGSVRAELSDGTELVTERVLVATGRRPNVDGLGLEAAGIDISDGRLPVDEHLRVADGIWGIGDVTGQGMFTHVGLYQAGIVEADILGQESPVADYTALPRAAFTEPQVGSVGMLEQEARAADLDVDVTIKRIPATFRGFVHGPGNEGVIKLVADRDAQVLVGATTAGPQGAEALGMLTLAIQERIPVDALQHMIYAFPTFFGGVGEAVGAYAPGLIEGVLDPGSEPLLMS